MVDNLNRDIKRVINTQTHLVAQKFDFLLSKPEKFEYDPKGSFTYSA